MTKKLNKKGFTLTELIVVIAIIAILAAVLIPTSVVFIGKAKQNADLQDATNAYKAWSAYATTFAGSDVEEEAGLVEISHIVFKGEREGYYYYLEDGKMVQGTKEKSYSSLAANTKVVSLSQDDCESGYAYHLVILTTATTNYTFVDQGTTDAVAAPLHGAATTAKWYEIK